MAKVGVVPVGVDHARTLHALVQKHADIAGQVEQAREAIRRLEADLAHVESVIHLFDPAIDVTRIRARRTRTRDAAGNGELTRILMDVLRDADRALTPRELTEHLMEERGHALDDRDLLSIMLKRVRAWLRSQRARGTVAPSGVEGATQMWRIVSDEPERLAVHTAINRNRA